ncbi:MAG TPA: hypothetical protein DCX46_07440, partial [Bacteroidetes bacterium]|nr:hypothetical protein [Bacteroidota bacterium]
MPVNGAFAVIGILSARLLYVLCLFSGPISAQAPLSNGMPASGVLGQPNFTSSLPGVSASSLNSPAGVAVDPTTGKVFVVDRYNNRILRWNGPEAMTNGSPAETVFGQTDFTSTAGGLSAASLNDPLRVYVDGSGTLWVSDYLNNRVLKFLNASSRATGASA